MIEKKINDVDLLDSWKIHNVFHMSLFQPYKEHTRTTIHRDEPPKVVDDKEILQLNIILMHKDNEI